MSNWQSGGEEAIRAGGAKYYTERPDRRFDVSVHLKVKRVHQIADGGGKLESMVGPALPRVTGSEGLIQDEHHVEKPRWQPPARSNPHYPRQQQAKHYSGDPGKRIGLRGAKGADQRLGGAPDVTGRINLPSLACSSGRSFSQSNLDRFLDETTPRVKTQTRPKVIVSFVRQL